MISGMSATSWTPPQMGSLSRTATILSSASPPSSVLRMPMTLAETRTSARLMGLSVITQMSSGSPSPSSAPCESPATRAPQYVLGMNPYNVGGRDELV